MSAPDITNLREIVDRSFKTVMSKDAEEFLAANTAALYTA